MLPKCSLAWGPRLDAWASRGIEGASTFGFTIALASMEGIEGHRGVANPGFPGLWRRGRASKGIDL